MGSVGLILSIFFMNIMFYKYHIRNKNFFVEVLSRIEGSYSLYNS